MDNFALNNYQDISKKSTGSIGGKRWQPIWATTYSENESILVLAERLSKERSTPRLRQWWVWQAAKTGEDH